ncbi:MAG: carboxypeptidase-like regulatory domain-containing protein [Bacteroidota bacterium]|nr:carboxypeptidase-like regulatory domain-containing protein [Bacteroidota bacterium]
MKRIHFALFLFSLSILSFNCQKEYSTTNFGTNNTGNNLPAPITAILQGNLLDENGQPAPGVQVTAGTKTAITNEMGYFRIINAALDKNASLVAAEKPGYFKAYRTFNATSGVNQVVIKLIKKTLAGTVDGNSGGEITLSNGAKITLPAKGTVNAANGTPYTGSVNVYSSYIDPTAADIDQTIPGSFMANDKNNKRVSLVSFGMMAVVLESASGEKLQIAKDKSAKLTIPIPSSKQSSAPSIISLWYVDEQTGLWKEEGTATKSGTSYVGDVKHFSFWNADFSNPSITVSMTLLSPQGMPLINANAQITGTSGGHACAVTDSLGQLSGLVPANENLILKIIDQCRVTVDSFNIGPFTQNTNLGNVNIGNATSSVVTVKGKLLNCNNQPVANGYAIIIFQNIHAYATADINGDFLSTFVTCVQNTTSCDIVGVDESSQQQGAVINTTIAYPVTNARNISACGIFLFLGFGIHT